MNAVDELIKERLKGVHKLAILGVGSVLRADDAAGVRVIENLQAAFDPGSYPDLLFCAGETAPENFSGSIRRFGPDHLVVIDAADLGLEAGAIAEIQPGDLGGPAFSTHMLPLRVMIDYLVRETGARVTLLGIQYKSIAFDAGMTPEVRDAVEELSGVLKRVIEDSANPGQPLSQ